MNIANPTSNGTAEAMPLQRVESDLLTREQAAAYLGVAVQTLAIWKDARRYDPPTGKNRPVSSLSPVGTRCLHSQANRRMIRLSHWLLH